MSLRILVIKPSSFGDIIHLFPALSLMRKKFPEAELDFIVNPEFASLLFYSPFPVRREIIFERRKLATWRFLPEFIKLLRDLRCEKYDIVIDFQGLFRSAWMAGVCRASQKVGFSGAREKSAEIFYNRKIKVTASHAVDRYVSLVKELFSITEEAEHPELPVNVKAQENLPVLPEKYIVLLPGTRWESKRFPGRFFSDICDKIRAKHPEYAFVAAGSAGEKKYVKEISGELIDMAGKTTLPELFELLRGASAVIGNDSGPLHAAAALKCNVFGFYGPTDPALTGPWGGNCQFFFADCGCAGCLERKCPDNSYRCWQQDKDFIADEICKVL